MKHYPIHPSPWSSKLTFAFAIALLITIFSTKGICYGQENSTTDFKQSLSTIEPYRMLITYDKTSHLIFPAAIRYVDIGSEYLVAGEAEGAENVLRLKAAIKDFEPETNISVITDDGRFYSFAIYYSPYPEALSYDLRPLASSAYKAANSPVLLQ